MTNPTTLNRRKSHFYRKQTIFVWCCIIPVVCLFLAFSYGPIINTIFGSFYDWNALSGRMEFSGLTNYQNMFSDRVVGLSLQNTLYFAAGAVLIKTILALALALCVHSIRSGQTFFRAVFFLPSICSMLATAFVFRFLFQADMGTINGYLSAIGIRGPGWLQDPSSAMNTVIIFTVWKDLGYVFLIFLAGIQGIPTDVIEAAVIDGASGWKRIWHIVLPLLRPVTAYNVATQVIGSLQAYTSIVGLTQSPASTGATSIGGPMYSTTTTCVYIYQVAFKDYRFGYGSAIALLLFVVIMLLTLVQLRMQSRKGDF